MGIKEYFQERAAPDTLLEFELIILTLAVGINDATTFSDYRVFASNQTGNTVFLCMALILPQLNGDMFITSNIGVGLGVFLRSSPFPRRRLLPQLRPRSSDDCRLRVHRWYQA